VEVSDEIDLAPVSRPEPQGSWDAPPPEGAAWRVSDFFNAMDAADKAYQFDQDLYARKNALAETIDRRNKDIERATGVTLENPWNGGYEADARDRLYKSGKGGNIWDAREQIWAEKLGALQTQYPEHADKIGADRPILEDAKLLSDYWSDRAAKGAPGLGATANLAASFLGGFRGFMRNPMNVATLAVGGGELRAASTAGRIAESFLREAVVNAGQQAIAEPGVQQWRAERGRENGVLPALEDIGVAALFGGALGAGVEGGRGLWRGWRGPVLPAETVTRASEGDTAALRELAATPVAESEPGLRAAVDVLEADEAVLADPPEGVTGHVEAAGQAADHAEGLSDALPEFMRPEEGEAFSLPLGAEARAAAERGEIAPHVAQAVAARVAEEGEQASIAQAAQIEGPRNLDEAAEAVSREMERRALPVAAARALEHENPPPAVPEAKGFDRIGQAIDRHAAELEAEMVMKPPAEAAPEPPAVTIKPKRKVTRERPSLFEMLASEGGLAPDGELAAIFDGNPFVPGFGRLLRKTGRTVDDALTLAKEQGYMFDPNEAEGMGPLSLSTNDLLDLLRREAHGDRVYSQADNEEFLIRSAEREGEAFVKRMEAARKKLEKAARAKQIDYLEGWDDDVMSRAQTLMAEDKTLSAVDGWAQAVQDIKTEAQARAEQFSEIQELRRNETGILTDWDEIERELEPLIAGLDAPARAGEGADAGPAPDAGGQGARAEGDLPQAGGGAGPDRAGAGPAGGAVEPGVEGKPQLLIPGVAPVSDRARAELLAGKPLRGGDAAAGGLFDDGARAQGDIFDAPTQTVAFPREDGSVEFVSRKKFLAPDGSEAIPDFILGCRE
jgi:hypothetical protein